MLKFLQNFTKKFHSQQVYFENDLERDILRDEDCGNLNSQDMPSNSHKVDPLKHFWTIH